VLPGVFGVIAINFRNSPCIHYSNLASIFLILFVLLAAIFVVILAVVLFFIVIVLLILLDLL
jgi:hypothetical protein